MLSEIKCLEVCRHLSCGLPGGWQESCRATPGQVPGFLGHVQVVALVAQRE